MYLRKKKTPHGEVLQLIESYRKEKGKPRNRVMISLGNPEIPEGYRKETKQLPVKHSVSPHPSQKKLTIL